MDFIFVPVCVDRSSSTHSLVAPDQLTHRRTLAEFCTRLASGSAEEVIQDPATRTEHRAGLIDHTGLTLDADRSEVQCDRFDERAPGPSQALQQSPRRKVRSASRRQEMGGKGVAREARLVDAEHAVTLPGHEHG